MAWVYPDIPLYRQLYVQLRAEIEAGRFVPGDLLPSERQLAAEHDLNRETVRKAIQLLAAEGVVRSYQGSGTMVLSGLRPDEG